MATNTQRSIPVPVGLVPFEDVKAGLATPVPEQAREEIDELVSTLPSKMGPYSKLYCYKGYWLSDISLPAAVALEQRFRPRPDDVIIASSPKCGTTWLIALTFATMVRRQHPPTTANHPLRRLNPHQCLPFLETLFAGGREAMLEALPSPRLMNTHMPLDFITQAAPAAGGGTAGCKVVYICREPKDMVVSLWHYIKRISPDTPLHDTFNSVCDGTTPWGPFWDHILGYWRASTARPENVLFLCYEEMLRDTAENVRRLARFVGQPFSTAEEEAGVVCDIVHLCSLENLKSMEANKTGYVNPKLKFPREALFRKGVTGDWKNQMTMEMARRLDEIVADKFRGTGLTFQ